MTTVDMSDAEVREQVTRADAFIATLREMIDSTVVRSDEQRRFPIVRQAGNLKSKWGSSQRCEGSAV